MVCCAPPPVAKPRLTCRSRCHLQEDLYQVAKVTANGQVSTAGQVVTYGKDRMVVSAVSKAQIEGLRQQVSIFSSMQYGIKSANASK